MKILPKIALSITVIALLIAAQSKVTTYAEATRATCIRSAPALAAKCVKNLHAGDLSVITSKKIQNGFYGVKNGKVSGWLYSKHVGLIYQGSAQ